MRHILWLCLTSVVLVACGPGPGIPLEEEATSPQYAPDDPCKGVVPQLCAY
ncbi:hypothetical protein [Palleronia sp. LCG004]|uniref:hypothetical protein n=1 Tax=Palleronia sp. LCG004 TaxID=3079304 RepID=UPI002943BC3D|nr:hypothetical protein [Palleronia sp. LCG004]WOI55352.1 hypothetical protein RVY76_09870 [Palleronia sp. LCG004]